LNHRGVATFLVAAQSGVMGNALNTPIDASYLCDSVVSMRFFEHLGQVKKAISVLKKRSGRHEESIREIWFASDGIHLGEPLMRLRGALSGLPSEIAGPGQQHIGLHEGPATRISTSAYCW